MGFPDSHPPPYMSRHGSGWPGHPGNHPNDSEQVEAHNRSRNSEINHGQYMPPRMNPPANPIGSKGTTHIFFKTRMCAKFLEGSCKNGPNCTFAHGIDDLREPPPNWQDLVRDGGSRNSNDDQKMIHKMKICRKFYNGEECPYGQSCNFLHERPNQNSVGSGGEWSRSNTINPYQREAVTPFQRDSAAISIGTQIADEKSYDRSTVAKVIHPNSDALVIKTGYWKTKICSRWEIGQCPFGERCHFAHGNSELHVPSVPVEADLSAIQVKPSIAPVIDLSHTKIVGEDKKFSGWKPMKKINKIYGDWFDDLTPRHASPNEVEDW